MTHNIFNSLQQFQYGGISSTACTTLEEALTIAHAEIIALHQPA